MLGKLQKNSNNKPSGDICLRGSFWRTGGLRKGGERLLPEETFFFEMFDIIHVPGSGRTIAIK